MVLIGRICYQGDRHGRLKSYTRKGLMLCEATPAVPNGNNHGRISSQFKNPTTQKPRLSRCPIATGIIPLCFVLARVQRYSGFLARVGVQY